MNQTALEWFLQQLSIQEVEIKDKSIIIEAIVKEKIQMTEMWTHGMMAKNGGDDFYDYYNKKYGDKTL